MPENSTTPLNRQTSRVQEAGAPRNNSNALVSGRYSSRTRFSQWRGIGKARPELAETEAACEAFLCQLETAVVDTRGAMTIEDASAADVACGALFVQRLAFRHILAGGLPPDVEITFAKDALKAQATRHEFIVRLDLNKQHDPWSEVYAMPAPALPVDSQAVPPAEAVSVDPGACSEGGAA